MARPRGCLVPAPQRKTCARHPQHQDESEDQRKLLYDLASLHLSEVGTAHAHGHASAHQRTLMPTALKQRTQGVHMLHLLGRDVSRRLRSSSSSWQHSNSEPP